MDSLKYPNVLVIGGTGFLGWHAVNEFMKRGYKVRVLALPPLPQEDIFPPTIEFLLADFDTLSDGKIRKLLAGQDAMVFAAGVDDRITPKRPAYPFFYRGNVEGPARLFRLARQAGVKRGVVLSSYFVHFASTWPQFRLVERHPYVRSRIEQTQACIEAGTPGMDVMTLGLPYIFGSMPGRIPLWKPLVDYIRSFKTIYYTKGGTACVSVQTVAEAVAGAVEHGKGGEYYLIGDENLTWEQMLLGLAAAQGLKRKVVSLPDGLGRFALWMVRLLHFLQGREGGLDPAHLADIQTNETFFDPEPARRALGFGKGDLKRAFEDTVKACPQKKAVAI